MSNDHNIAGGSELDALLQTLSVKIERNILRSALRAGANVLKEEAKTNVPIESGDLRKSVRISTRAKRGVVTASLRAGDAKAFYWHFVEFGTAAHHIKSKNGRALSFAGVLAGFINHPGARAKPFLRPALDAKADQALEAVGMQIRKRLTLEGINTLAPEAD